MAPNLALISIPAYAILSVFPHSYALTLLSNNDLSKFENQNPRSEKYIAAAKQRMTAEQFARYERSEAAHKNNLESFPLFVATVFAGLLAEQSAKGTLQKAFTSDNGVPTGLMRFVYSWFAVRIAYNIAYITTTTNKWSFVRSLLYMAGIGLSCEQIYSAAKIIGS